MQKHNSINTIERKNNYIVHQAHNEIMQDNLISDIINTEFNNQHNDFGGIEMSIDDWNNEYQEIYNELNEYLAK